MLHQPTAHCRQVRAQTLARTACFYAHPLDHISNSPSWVFVHIGLQVQPEHLEIAKLAGQYGLKVVQQPGFTSPPLSDENHGSSFYRPSFCQRPNLLGD